MTQLTQLIAQGISSGAIYRLRPGYWVRAILSAAETLADGWLCTGDLGRDLGRVQLLGRLRARAIGTRGESISPEVAEDAFRLSAYIAEAGIRRHCSRSTRSGSGSMRSSSSSGGDPSPTTPGCSDRRRSRTGAYPRTIACAPSASSLRSLHQGDEELTPALRLNRSVVASRYANLSIEPLGV